MTPADGVGAVTLAVTVWSTCGVVSLIDTVGWAVKLPLATGDVWGDVPVPGVFGPPDVEVITTWSFLVSMSAVTVYVDDVAPGMSTAGSDPVTDCHL